MGAKGCAFSETLWLVIHIPPIAPIPVSEAGAGHAFAQAAFFEKILLQPAELLVNQVVGLVDQADRNVGNNFRRARFHELAVKFVGLWRFASELADKQRFLGVFIPFAVFAHAEVVAVVVEQFLKAGAATVPWTR